MFADLLAAATRLGDHGSLAEVPDEIVQRVPAKFGLHDVTDGIIRQVPEGGDIKHLRAVFACLKSDGLAREGLEQPQGAVAGEIASWVGRSIVPIGETSPTDRSEEEDDDDDDSEWWKGTARRGELGLQILAALCVEFGAGLDDETLLVVAAYTNAAADPWTSRAASTAAGPLLDQQLLLRRGGDLGAFITSTVLTGFLRPLFSAARPAAVTASGRKAEYVTPGGATAAGLSEEAPETERKPWKHARRYAVTVFEWAVLHSGTPRPLQPADATGPGSGSGSGPDLLSQHWHQYTPVLLALLDDNTARVRIRGLSILRAFWARCPPGLMDRVGLADVFEQAVFPIVLYLPSLTPEPESISLLAAAYPALFQIAGLPDEDVGESHDGAPMFTDVQRRRLDKIVREGILVGYHHAGEFIHLTELFCKIARSVVNGMGILAVKHLKDLIPMVSAIATDPFGTKYTPALLAAIELLQAIMRCCWPRIGAYRTEIINILTMCYLNIEDEDDYPAGAPSKEEICLQLTRTGEILSAIMASEDGSLAQTVMPLVEKEPLLGRLFNPMSSPHSSSSGGARVA